MWYRLTGARRGLPTRPESECFPSHVVVSESVMPGTRPNRTQARQEGAEHDQALTCDPVVGQPGEGLVRLEDQLSRLRRSGMHRAGPTLGSRRLGPERFEFPCPPTTPRYFRYEKRLVPRVTFRPRSTHSRRPKKTLRFAFPKLDMTMFKTESLHGICRRL